ncbi:MAG: energy transducer TonB [Thermoanaerobaculia bacterium]
MFDVPLAARRRPMFGVSAALHAALGLALVVPPLVATQEPPEPDGFVRIEFVPRLASDAPALEKVDFLGKADGGRATAPAPRANDRPRGGDAPITQPNGVAEVLPAPTGGQLPSSFEETGEQSEPGKPGRFGKPGTGDDGDGEACEGCGAIPATAPGVTPPVPLETVSPAYPEPARRAHVEGVVLLKAIIGADGSVRDVRVLKAASVLLDPAALEAVRRWRYLPARVGKRPVPVYLDVVVTFSLKNL